MKSGNLNFLEPSGPLQACNGTDLPFTESVAQAMFEFESGAIIPKFSPFLKHICSVFDVFFYINERIFGLLKTEETLLIGCFYEDVKCHILEYSFSFDKDVQIDS